MGDDAWLDDLLAEFEIEAADTLDEADAIAIRASRGTPAPDDVGAAFRAFHSLKSAAGFLELAPVEAVLHAMEDRLLPLRDGGVPLDPITADLVLAATAEIRRLVALCKGRRAEGTPMPDVAESGPFLAMLRRDEAPDPTAEPAPPQPPATPPATTTRLVKVEPRRIERITDRIAEVAAAVGHLALLLDEVGATSPAVGAALSRLQGVTRTLADDGLSLRLVPVASLLARMRRVAMDVAAQVGRRVDVQVDGASIELDRALVERLVDPLVHLVRNAVDHGVEPPEDREAAGKAPVATVRLTAESRDGRVLVGIEDDGRGIDRARVAERARARGLLDDQAPLTDAELWRVLSAPGLSTARAVTAVSGRGVGLDVVRRRIEEVGGVVTVRTRPGEGTRFELSLPTSLAVIDAAIARVGDAEVLLPYAALREVRAEPPGGVPIVHLGDGARCVAVLGGPRGPVGVAVDRIVGRTRAATRALPPWATSDGLFSSAATLPSGAIGLVVCPCGASRHAHA